MELRGQITPAWLMTTGCQRDVVGDARASVNGAQQLNDRQCGSQINPRRRNKTTWAQRKRRVERLGV